MTLTSFLSEFEIPEDDIFVYSPKIVQLERPTKRLLDTSEGQEWHDYDKMIFNAPKDPNTEGGEFGWYLESAKFPELAEPLFLLEVIETILEDEGDSTEALELVFQEWFGAFKRVVDARELAITDFSVPEDALKRVSTGAASMGQELREFGTALGFDMEELEEREAFSDYVSTGEVDIDPDKFGKWF